jgi:SAM-dependent methyltransferase
LLFRIIYNLVFILLLTWGILLSFSNLPTAASPVYEQQENHSSDGIGKYYMVWEIAQVIGYIGAGWLERPNREAEEKPSQIINLLNLKPDEVVADTGAGTGYLSFLIAPLLPEGRVLAVDIQPEMLEIMESFKQEKNINNIEPILAIMVDAYHE